MCQQGVPCAACAARTAASGAAIEFGTTNGNLTPYTTTQTISAPPAATTTDGNLVALAADGNAAVQPAADPTAPGLPERWDAVLVVEGLRTADHRLFTPGAFTWRDLPIPLYAQFTNDGHYGAPLVGKVDTITRDDRNRILGSGTFDLSTEAGQTAARMCADQLLRFGSCDYEPLETRYVELMVDGGVDEWGDPVGDYDWYEECTSARIAGWTMVGIPAFPQACVVPAGQPLPDPAPMDTGGGGGVMVDPGLIAGAFPAEPPAEWFDNPALAGPTPLTIGDDGHVFGHLATWDSCHTGYTGRCVTPPRTASGYAYFLQGRVKTADGTEVPVGHLTVATGHADGRAGAAAAAEHYDNTGACFADVTVGEDDHGIWVAGALRPDVTDEQLRAARASALSGDWRPIRGNLELVAALSVNSPGFPIVAASYAGDRAVSLVASGPRPLSPGEILAGRLARLESAMDLLAPLAASALAGRVDAVVAAATR